MAKFHLVCWITLTWIFHSVTSFRNDLNLLANQPRPGCIWSPMEIESPNGTISIKENSKRGTFFLDCNLRTLNPDFWNYSFNSNQIEQTSKISIECSDKLFFESFLQSNQSLFKLVNLNHVIIQKCKIRKMPTRIWGSLGYLKTLTLNSNNGDWSSSIGLEIEADSFQGLGQLEELDLSHNNIWSLPNKHIFCPMKSLLKLNLSRNRLSDLEELSASASADLSNYCSLNIIKLDLSYNSLRRVGSNSFANMRKVSELYLQNNLMEELEDTAFSTLDNLRLLNLSSNRLVALPPSIFRLNLKLREINLSNNSISALSPQVFLNLEELMSLDLSQNTLSSQWVKDNMFNGLKRLVILKLSMNQLSYIDSSIFKDLGSLQALHLDGNKIETIHPGAFGTLRNLHLLDLSRNRLTYVDSRAFSNLFGLRQLYLDQNKIRNMDDNALKNCTNLQDLGLANNLLQEVPVALRTGLSHLVTLDVGENRIGSVNNKSFSGLSQLYGLRMVDNRLTELPQGFCDPLKKLRVLNIAQNRISSISVSAFSSCPELKALRLDTNSMEELPPTLAPQLPSLLWLNVSENRLRWADYHLLPQTIEWLDLSYNKLESLGGPTSSSERSQSSIPYSLRVLDASHNLLTTLDYTTIPPTLETLRVNHNKLKSVASDTFIRSGRLRRVELIGNQLENLPLSSLRFPPVPVGKQLPEFYLGGNPFLCDCSMEWLTRVNQLTVLRTHPRIVDLDAIVCRPTFSRENQVVPLIESRAKDFLCPYKAHCFALCHCCDFDACDCEMQCPGNCTCYHDTAWSANIVECSGLDYTEVPKRIPMDATEIYLDGNEMAELGSHIFIGKKNLRVLYLNDSKIEFVRNKTFNGLRQLEVLRLEENLLTELNGYEFGDLESLRELYLQNNLLGYIAKETFVQLKMLQVLRLDGNLLIDYNVWELSGNGYLNSVMLAGNRWSCECEFLIPFRTWVASKSQIVVDFTLASCESVNSTHVSSGSSSLQEIEDESHIIPNTQRRQQKIANSKMYPIQTQHLISSMCSHNSELNFNFNINHHTLESEILTNHISSLPNGAEKVTIPHHNLDRDVQYSNDTSIQSLNTFWTLLLTFTALILLAIIIVVIFRKEIYYWIYTRVFTNQRELPRSTNSNSSSILQFFKLILCCREKGGKKHFSSNSSDSDSDKLFDAYFIYSKKDEDILLKKIAPELESQSPGNKDFRLCLHYRDLCLNEDNPWNTDMILSACDASKRVVLVLSRTFLQNENQAPNFREAIQSAMSRHQKKLILILLPPFSEQNLHTICPELGNKNRNKSIRNSVLEWDDKNFWSKFKLILPTPSSITFTTNSNRRGNSVLISGNLPPLIDLSGSSILSSGNSSNNSNASFNGTMSSYTLNRDFPYNSGHQYHRNILPYQIPIMSQANTLNPPVPKHHIALSSPFYQQQHHQSQNFNMNHYNSSQHSGQYQYQHYFPSGSANFVPIPGIPTQVQGNVVYPMQTLPHRFNQQQQQQQHNFSFNESFRRHLQQQQQQNPVLQFVKINQTNNQSGGNGTNYQPLDPNYSSSAISSSAEELEHVYSTLDSPLQSPNSNNTTQTSVMNSSGGGESVKNSPEGKNDKSANNIGTGRIHGNGSGKEFSSQNTRPELPGPRSTDGQPGTNGQMYFV